jgi:hypothetical protein
VLPSRITPLDVVREVGAWAIADVRERTESLRRQNMAAARAHADFDCDLRDAIREAESKGTRDDLRVLQHVESVLRDERCEHFVAVARGGGRLSYLHRRGNADQVSFDEDDLLRWLDRVPSRHVIALHSHPQPSSVLPSFADRKITKMLFSLSVDDHFVILPSDDELRFRVYSFAQRRSMTLDTIECADDDRQLAAARRRR